MSTTLVPPTFYAVKAGARPARIYRTIAGAAAAVFVFDLLPSAVTAVTGSRTRRLTETELRELWRQIWACQLSSGPRAEHKRPIRADAPTRHGAKVSATSLQTAMSEEGLESRS